ncbi:MAG: hypothetical protein ACLUE2_15890 [Bacteroides cellulosilyticus]
MIATFLPMSPRPLYNRHCWSVASEDVIIAQGADAYGHFACHLTGRKTVHLRIIVPFAVYKDCPNGFFPTVQSELFPTDVQQLFVFKEVAANGNGFSGGEMYGCVSIEDTEPYRKRFR